MVIGWILCWQSSVAMAWGRGTPITPTTFWHDVERVHRELPAASLVPPPALLEKLQQAPFRGGLEPVDADQGIPWHHCEILEGTLPVDLHGTLCRNVRVCRNVRLNYGGTQPYHTIPQTNKFFE
jgi:hypothetical protein